MRAATLDDDPVPLANPEDAFADEHTMNEINRRSEQFMADLAREHDADIETYLDKIKNSPPMKPLPKTAGWLSFNHSL